jgi:integrase
MLRRTESGWLADIQPGGRRGKRFRKTFKTKAEALRWEAHVASKEVHEPWNKEPADKRRLLDLLTLWFDNYGHGLKTEKHRFRVLECLIEDLGNPLGRDFQGSHFTSYRSVGRKSNATYNNELAYLRAMFNELARLDLWTTANPLSKTRQLPKQETELSWLTPDQMLELLEACNNGRNPDTGKVARVCLSTGARWTEAESIERPQVLADRLRFIGTKNGQIRTVPVSRDILDIFPLCPGRQFSACYSAFREAVDRAGIELPDGQLTHVLRHYSESRTITR